MEVVTRILQLAVFLSRKGYLEETRLLRKVLGHYVPEDKPGVPSFWRRNYDYGEGFYFGDMSEKPSVKEWREKHKGKGPNFPKKKRKST